MRHRHHKIPKHIGGSNDPDNIELLTIEEHAEAHKKLFESDGRWQDRLAWHFLSGLIGKEDVLLEAQRLGKAKMMADPVRAAAFCKSISIGVSAFYAAGGKPWNKDGIDPRCEKLSVSAKIQSTRGPEHFHCIGDYQRGRKFDEEHKLKLKTRARKREPKTCMHCGKVTVPSMHGRWHGDNCRFKS